MTSVTRSPARSALVSGESPYWPDHGPAAGLGAAGCDSGEDIEGNQDGAPSDHGTDAPAGARP